MNVLLAHGYYDIQDQRLVQGIKSTLWYARPRGRHNPPSPHVFTIDMWDINDDYEDFVSWTARRLDKDYGNTVILTPNRDQVFDCPIATVQLKHPARLAHLINLGVDVRL